MATHRGPRMVRNGLYLCYDFADKKSYPGSGATVFNLSNGGPINKLGTNFNGTLYNQTFQSDNCGRMYFPGSLAAPAGIIPANKPKPIVRLTCEVWGILLYPTDGYVSYIGDPTPRAAWAWGPESTWRCIYSDAAFQFTMSTVNNPWGGQSATFLRTRDDNWHHYICVYDGTNAKIYVDGVLQATSGALSGNVATAINQDTTIIYRGGGIFAAGKGYIGYYAEHDYAFSEAEVRQNFTARRTRFGI